jgi:hypothetical protein
MKAAPFHDVFTDNGMVREDGRVVYDRYLVKVKRPEDSKYPWTICRSSRKSRPIRRFGLLAPRDAILSKRNDPATGIEARSYFATGCSVFK